MKKQRLLAVALVVCLASVSFSQQQDQKPSEGDVVRITTNLVQIDAVITDKNGNLVTDLKPDELQLLEDKRAQKITHFSYIAPPPSKSTLPTNRTPGIPPDRLRPKTCDELFHS
jgi:hypothetical protein